jgi:hypothetical protein
MFWHLHRVSKELSIVVGKTTSWNALEIIKTNYFNYWEMISQKGLYTSFFKNCIEFEMWCLDRFFAMFDG